METLAAIVQTHAEQFMALEKRQAQLVAESNPYATQIEEKWTLTRCTFVTFTMAYTRTLSI